MIDQEIEQYYKENYDQLVKKLTRRAGSPENAEDIIQEAFTRALQFKASYNPEKSFEGWFVGILNNSFRTFKRDELNMGMARDSLKNEEEAETEGEEEWEVLRHEAMEKVNTLPQSDQEIVRLHFFLGYTKPEVVRILDESYRRVVFVTDTFKQNLERRYR